MTDAVLLGGQLYAKLAELVAPPGSLDGNQNVVLVEACGRDLDPEDFGTDPEVAGAEAFAELVNAVPVPGATFVDSARRLDDVTQLVLLNAAPEPADGVTSPAAVLVEQARADLELMARGSTTPGDVYHPAKAEPTHWYDPSDVWPSASFRIGGSTPPVPAPPEVVAVPPPALVWTRCPAVGVVPDPVREAASGRLSLTRLRRDADLGEALRRQLVMSAPMAPVPVRLSPELLRSGAVKRAGALTLPRSLQLDRSVLALSTDVRADLRTSAHSEVQVDRQRPVFRDLQLAHRLLVDAAPTVPVQPTGGFELSFSYRVVSITRPWWHPELFAQPGWTMRGFNPGALSTGTPTENSGLLGAVTTRMLLVRDLTVSGTWSDADAGAASAAQEQFGTLGLGPFSLTGEVGWDHSSLTRPGVQAVAWVASLTPFFPGA